MVPNSTQQLNCWSRVLASRLATRPLALFTITIVPPAFDVLSYLLRLSSLDDTCSFVLVAPAPPAALLLSDFSASLESLQGSLDGRSAAEFALLRRALSLAVPPPPPPGGLADPLAAGQVRTIEPFYVSSR